MAFPADLTNALDGVTEIVAAHLNNLEAKVGVDNSAVPASLDYLLRNAGSIEPGHKHNRLWTANGSSEVITILNNGNVGIGTTNPVSKLNIYSGGSDYAEFKVESVARTPSIHFKQGANDWYWKIDHTDSKFKITKDANVFATIDSSGNTGIGTASPGKKLDVNGYVRGVGIFNTLNSAPADGDLATGECALWFDMTDGAAKLMIKAKQADGTVKTGSVPLN